MAEWRTVHRVGQRGLNDGGDKPDSLSDTVIFFRIPSNRLSHFGENFIS